jgi:UrcA family protein
MTRQIATTLSSGFLLAAALSGSCTSFASAPTLAADPTPSRIVRYADLDLETPAGVHALYGRIQDAAWRVCRELLGAHNAASGMQNLRCRQQLVDAAIADVNVPALTALRSGKKTGNLAANR